jgi:hypothetical protein
MFVRSPIGEWTHIGHGELRDIRTAAKLKVMASGAAGWISCLYRRLANCIP